MSKRFLTISIFFVEYNNRRQTTNTNKQKTHFVKVSKTVPANEIAVSLNTILIEQNKIREIMFHLYGLQIALKMNV